MAPKKRGDRSLRAGQNREKKKPVRAPKKTPNPRSLANLRPAWAKGESGNPGGRPKRDIAAEIAQLVFESSPEAIAKAMLKKLKKGDAKSFTALADRAYGKAHQQMQHSGEIVHRLVLENVDVAAQESA